MIRRVCLVSREMEGVAGAGGMKDAVRGIADALVQLGIDVTVVIPSYGFVEPGIKIRNFDVAAGARHIAVTAAERRFDGIRVILLEADVFCGKLSVYTYTEGDAPSPDLIGKGHLDVHEMNIVLQAGATRFLLGEGSAPDIVHGHDGHTGLLPLFMKPYSGSGGFFAHTGILVTIHNAGAAYQQAMGTAAESAFFTGLSEHDLAKGMIGGAVNPLLIAARYSVVNTVSPWYAREILSRNDLHSGPLGAAYRKLGLRLKGVTNGIVPRLWGKDDGPHRSLDKELNRRNLAASIRTGLPDGVECIGAYPDPDRLWVMFHNRITGQKGLDEVLRLPTGRHTVSPYAMLILGKGEPEWEKALADRCRSSGNWTFLRGYNANLAERLFAASSFVLVPSAWEPCGQIDMIGQLHGALPVVRRVGGLKKVRRFLDGFGYSPRAKRGLAGSLETAIWMEIHVKSWVRMMRRLAENVVYGKRSWRKVVIRGYLPLYRKALRRSRFA